ncbi:MAG TPA: hypothetical protein VGH16_07135 [Candidatus Binatia bacterium]|jgi:hypothetical protein
MNSLRSKVLLLCVLFLASCGITPIPPHKLSQARTIGAISLLGDQLHIAQVGTTVFNNVDKDEKAGWAIDRFTTHKIKSILAGKNNLRFVDIDYKYSEFEPIYRSTSRFPAFDYDLKDVREPLLQLKSVYGIDLLILVARVRERVVNSPMSVHGCAIYSESFLGLEIKTRAFLAAEIAVVDMTDLKVLSDARMFGSKLLGHAIWKEHVKDYRPEELRLLDIFCKSVLESKLDGALAGFGLIPVP